MPLVLIPFLGGGALGAWFGVSVSDGFSRLTWALVAFAVVFSMVKFL